jgi:hypothetical protein
MQVVNFTEARNNLKTIFDTVYHNDEEVIVHRKNNENVAIISMETYNQLVRHTVGSDRVMDPGHLYADAEAFERERKMFRDRLSALEGGMEKAVPFDTMWDSIDAELSVR